jgi:trans-2,3-dihydro-3-hydroxyanthranilate isomerase
MDLDFTLVDVFSDRPFGGNQLAVFHHADGIDDATMQQLAREFNFAEVTFVFPPRDPANTGQVRIFSPKTELPFAGHPTVGTAAVVAALAEPDQAPIRRLVFEEGIGPVAITIDGPLIRLHLNEPQYETSARTPSTAVLAKALTLPDAAVLGCWYASVGVRFCFVHLADAGLVDRATLDKATWTASLADCWSPHLYIFAGDVHDGARLQARMFAPGLGIEEDPATGSACAALVASLADSSQQADCGYRLQIDQGVAMGRPSVLQAMAVKTAGRLAEVCVEGHATIIGRGVITIGAQ